jgi:MTH538 TIR-like domain (DUF1863)
MSTRTQRELQAWIDSHELRLSESLTKAEQAVRHKCFVSYHHDDTIEAKAFIEAFEKAFIPRVLGVSDEDDFIDSTDTDYVMDQIREKYLTDSTVTIVLVGKCTWARRYIDWEVFSTLRNDKNNRRSGLMAITLPSVATYEARELPPRIDDNVADQQGYARWRKYPSTTSGLQKFIDEAFDARATKAHLIDNTRERKINNSRCTG